MSNAQIIQDLYAAFGRGDVPAILARLSEDVEWEYGGGTTDVPWLQPRRGREAAAGFFASLDVMRLERFNPKVFLEQDRVVIVLLDVEFVVKATGQRVFEEDEVHIWWFDAQGRITRFRHQVDTLRHHLAYHK